MRFSRLPGFNPTQSFDDFIQTPVHIGLQVVESPVQIVEALVLRPLGDPDLWRPA
jgi:hypothetical protein